MKRLVLVAALAGALAACGDAAEEADGPVAAETAATAEAAAADAATTLAGTYEYEMEGKQTTAVLNPDGTYTDTQDGTVVESGTWREMTDGKACFDAEGEDTAEVCFTTTEPGADGVFVATPSDGSEPLTIKRIS